MITSEIRCLLDLTSDTGAGLSSRDLTALAQLNRHHPLDVGFLIAIGQRFRSTGIPSTLPAYARSFVLSCIRRSAEYGLVDECVYTTAAVDDRRYLYQLVELARQIGLTARENRYVYQLNGLRGFGALETNELAEQDGVAPPYVSKVKARFERNY
jgi:hypothetical protein